MKHTIIALVLSAIGLIFLSGCSSSPQTLHPSGPSATYPRSGKPDKTYDYALEAWKNGEFEEAAHHFEAAAIVRTESGLFEFECLLNAVECWSEAGFPDKARDALARARAINPMAAPSMRERYFSALLSGSHEPMLTSALRSTLPN